MTDKGPWRVFWESAAIVVVVLGISAAVLHFAPVASAFGSIEHYLEGRGFEKGAAENFAAGLIQTLIELLFLTGAFALISLVARAFQQRTVRVRAARQVFNAYKRFIEKLAYLHRQGSKTTQTSTFFDFQIAQLSRALDALQVRPLDFGGALPHKASEAFDDALNDLDNFYLFADRLTSWVSAPTAAAATRPFFVLPATRDSPAPPGEDSFVKLHDHMLRFFTKLPTPGALKKQLRGDLQNQMKTMGASYPFITVERRASGS